MTEKPLVGISACLAGYQVRYDGEHRYNPVIASFIADKVRLLPICPEAAIGMGIPRPPIQIQITDQGPIAVGRDDPALQVTAPLRHFANTISKVHQQLAGYILQSRSPSCGFNTTPMHNSRQEQIGLGSGLFAATLQLQRPDLPLVNDTELITQADCDAFLSAVFRCHQALTG